MHAGSMLLGCVRGCVGLGRRGGEGGGNKFGTFTACYCIKYQNLLPECNPPNSVYCILSLSSNLSSNYHTAC